MIKRAFSSARKIPVPQIEKCYYKTLGVSKDANSHDIRQSYLTLAKAWHPDKILDEDQKDDALAYYEHLDLENPTRYIADKLLETNESKGDNPLIPYEGMENDFKINKIKILNHKWILADFSDGKYWGEVLIGYELKDDMGVDFTLKDHLLYTRSN